MRALTLMSLTILSLMSMAYAGTNALAEAQRLAKSPSSVYGPNCFNTALYLSGFTNFVQYTSGSELELHVQNFCKIKDNQSEIATGNLVLYYAKQNDLVHAAFALNANQILEKDSLNSKTSPKDETDPKPGQYVVRNLEDSLYGMKKSQKLFQKLYERRIFECLKRDTITQELSIVNSNPLIADQFNFRKKIQEISKVKQAKDRDKIILSDVVPYLKSLNIQSTDAGSKAQNQYWAAITQSNLYQVHLFVCAESMKKYDECYNPKMQLANDQLDRIFHELREFETSLDRFTD